MNQPILICQFYPSEGAGYLATFLDNKQIPWQLLRIDQGDTLPQSLQDYSGLVMMGGPMSVNDDLPWIPPLLDLIQQAQTNSMPMLGHCLGGQLIAKALSATISANKVKEIGWGLVNPSYHKTAQAYFGSLPFTAFHWHGETFSLPEGATHLLSSPYCENQAFAIGNTLAMQCHLEMTSDMVKEWCIADRDYLMAALGSPSVQKPEIIQKDIDNQLKAMQSVADKVFQQWLTRLT
jgi:GMP synthase-like glutamine amidotransferase